MRIHHEPLRNLVAAVFEANGSNSQEADQIAEHLVQANLVGHDSHGVIRTPIYISWLRAGNVFANRALKIDHEMDALVLADGQLGYGQTIGKQVVELGLEKCRRHGAVAVALRNSGHLGRIGHWAELAAEAGCVSMHFVNTSGLGMFVVPAGGLDARLSVNPITIGIPVPNRPPAVLDIAAAATAEGKLKVARNRGEQVPDDWILDADGRPTNDPNDFYGPPMGAILPMAGYKGYGLCLMIELLAGALTGSGCSQAGITEFEQGMFSVFVDPSQLPIADFFGSDTARFIDFVRSSRTAPGIDRIRIPGDIEVEKRQQRMANGIELDTTTWEQITTLARECDVPAELIEITPDS